jgi:hypothetical protein
MTTVTALTPLDVLRGGLENIRTYGWTQHEFGDINDGFCINGAVNYAGTGDSVWVRLEHPNFKVLQSAKHALRNVFDILFLAEWNDEPGRTKEEVIALFEQAIAKLEQAQ